MAPPYCVYVVDDDDSVRRTRSGLLLASGHCVRPYASPARFLADLPRDSHDCLITDMTMPRMTDLQTNERMRAEWRASREDLGPDTQFEQGDTAFDRAALSGLWAQQRWTRESVLLPRPSGSASSFFPDQRKMTR